MSKLDIVNGTKDVAQNIYDAYNTFIFSDDIKVFGKLMLRHYFFNKIKLLPGDIVELGVFKGSGVTCWLKLIKMYASQSNKKVIGFDFFNSSNLLEYCETQDNGDYLKEVINRVDKSTLEYDEVKARILSSDVDPSKLILVKGDVSLTTKKFSEENPGLRISLLYLDLDLGEPTYYTLLNFWKHIVPGGYIVFDEYDFHKFTECIGVENFLREKNIEYTIESTNFISPSAYMIKKK